MRQTKGFTLPELLVAVSAIFLLVGAVAGAQFSLGETAPDTYAADAVRSYMQLARLEAIRSGHAYRFRITPDDGSLAVLDGRGTRAPGDDTLIHVKELAGGVQFEDGVDEPFEVAFDRHGKAKSPREHLEVTYRSDRYRVSVFANGSTLISHWDGSQWIPGA